MQNQWILRQLTADEDKKKILLADELGISTQLARLLILRGVETFDQAKAFFRPELSSLHDPFLIKDMREAVDRLNKALKRKEKILIYGDYDVDGTTAVALVYKFLQPYMGASQIDFYIPDRYDEGYGVSKKGIEYAHTNGVSLIITLDCGIKAIEEVDYAALLGIDVIVCDHHTTDDVLPRAVAVLDSKRADDNYPYKHLSGCGVGFKFMQAFAQDNGIDFSQLESLLDLVAVSIASDIVPITGENRILAHYGLKCLNESPSCGLKAIMDVCNLRNTKGIKKVNEAPITVNDIIFKIGPRINASGRMKSGREVVELLVSNSRSASKDISANIDEYNSQRREIDQQTTSEAEEYVTPEMVANRRSIVVYNPEWHKGIVGIVASRLTEKYYKPTVVLTKANDMISGSARSVQGFDLYSAIDSCRDILENFGGHTYAAGLTMKEENLEAFVSRFEAYVTANITDEQLSPQIEVDSELKFSDITPKFIRLLRQFEPFGPGNPKPIFATHRVFDYNNNSKVVGRDSKHLKLELIDDSSDSVMNGIAFRMASFSKYLKEFMPLDIVYTLEDNTFYGVTSTQLQIQDIHTECMK